jgi:uncharacterized protein YfaS (alpha-2-macroglobulin family)
MSLRARYALLLVLLAAIPGLVVCAGGAPPKTDQPPPPPPPNAATPKLPEVDKLVDDQKLAEALPVIEAAMARARKQGDEDLLAYALVRHCQLRIALSGWETAVHELKAEAWPKAPVPSIAIELYYAHALSTYLRSYSWEIGKREKVDTKGTVDLKAWTKEQIVAEATKAYAHIWGRRAELASWPVILLAPYLQINTYPQNVRGTLRDAVAYLTVEHLADSSQWRPDQSNDLFRVDFARLLDGHDVVPLEGDAHPLQKVAAILDDLETFHLKNDRPEAALEARLERLRRLRAAYTDERERELLTRALVARLGKERTHPWWAMGQHLLAEWAQDSGELVRAHRLAREGRDAYPASIGGKRCATLVASIEAPDYQISAMVIDALGKPSINVAARNLPKIYLRAYPLDQRARLGRAKDYNLEFDDNELRRLLPSKPAVAWTVDLPPTPDFLSHRTAVTPPLHKKGHYAIIASARADFSPKHNRLVSAQVSISDVVLSVRNEPSGQLTVTAFDGPSGRLVPGAAVELWAFDWQHGHHKIEDARTDAGGVAHVGRGHGRSDGVFVVASRGDDLTLDPRMQYLYPRGEEPTRTNSLVYTDRSVYRPGQKILWKVVAYTGRAQDGRFAVAPGRSFTVRLRDANYQEVQKVEVKSSAYGSAAGSFVVPAGRLLGAWHVETSLGGSQQLRVEEYKRPTFEVTLQDPAQALRLNQPARLSGEARYYFGLPVTAGTARYTITRDPVFPYWWSWYWHPTPGGTQTIARGSAPLGADGRFDVKFLPEAKAGLDPRVSYRYSVSVDVTDEGGETRSANRGYRLGRSTVEAVLSATAGFYEFGRPISIDLRRTDLDGKLRAGRGRWKLFALDVPKQTLLPAELPPEEHDKPPTEGPKVVTPGDRHRARYETQYDVTRILASWKEGVELDHGELSATSAPDSKLDLRGRTGGAYRLRYETTDEQGNPAEAMVDFVVAGKPLPLPLLFRVEHDTVTVGDKLRLFISTGIDHPTLVFETYRADQLIARKIYNESPGVIELPMSEADRGGLAFVLTTLRDHQAMVQHEIATVPWDNQSLKLSFATFRDRLRPGAHETFRVTVESDGKHPQRLAAGAAELLAYMYDRSLDLFAPHNPPSPLSLFPFRAQVSLANLTLGAAPEQWLAPDALRDIPASPEVQPDRYVVLDDHGVGGMGARARFDAFNSPLGAVVARAAPAPAPEQAPMSEAHAKAARDEEKSVDKSDATSVKQAEAKPANTSEPVRSNFAETAFFEPALLTDQSGQASFEFTVPDSVTSWNVWVHAITKDLRSGSIRKETRSVKDLMVRPYLPRFLREGDEAQLKVVVNNAGGDKLDGKLSFDIVDAETMLSKAALFSLDASPRAFKVEPGKSTSLTFPVKAPRGIGTYAIVAKATAQSGKETFSDGEQRPIPLLPSRLHLMQSRFVTLRDVSRRTMKFDDLARNDDPSRASEQLVVTLDAQLFYTVLRALPYLIDYPYECVEQTLNRFVSTGIVTSLFQQYPQVAKMADQMSKRTTQLAAWDSGDANRKMALEEAPFLTEARGGASKDDTSLINVLDQRIARANRDSALDKLKKMQTSLGAFPWFPGGPPSPYMTLYVLYGFAKAAEFKVDVPRDIVQRGWQYLARHYREDIRSDMRKHDCCWEFLALLNYVASSYPDASWTGNALTPAERKEILDFTFKHFRQSSPYVKGLLALTLKRMGRAADGRKVFDSVMDSAKTSEDQGTYWAQEDRSWLWYNDTIESHAFALRVLMELDPKNAKKDGLVLWLLLNKKLNQWKSTRATAEVIYSLAEYMKADQSLGVREAATVSIGARQQTYTFEPDRYVGKVQMIVPGPEVNEKSAQITVEKKNKGVMFASATWHYATDKLPTEGRGDFFNVSRKYFLRENNGREYVLKPLADGQALHAGDEVEVELDISTKHEAEYVHLRDPRGAGFEPSSLVSRYKWDLGLGYYEEVRDSGENFFFEHLPVGQYTFKYRIRATTAGSFRVGPATLQSMYAPEFNAFSAGHVLKIAAN